ncbi:uncharacterized protein ACNLHF_022612 [Anomaloglossus baeobatrachus]
MYNNGLSSAVAKNRLSGLAFHFKLRGWSDVTKFFIVRQAVKGWSRGRPGKESRRPVSFSLLSRIIDGIPAVCPSPFESALFSASFALAFFGALRIGELVSSSKGTQGGLWHDDVILTNLGLRIRIRKSKTDQSGAAKPVIWLLGHSYIFWAGQRAENRPGGRALGFRGFEVNWRGIRGLIWPQVLPEVVGIARSALSPVVLVIHAGGNDLGSRRLAELITTMRSDLDKLHAFFPELVIVWSEVVSRVVWRRAQGAAALERSRRTLNSRISRFVRFKAGIVVRHRQLEGDNSPLMITDGVHLNEIGLDIFLSGLQDGIEQALCLMGGGRSAA